MNQNGTTGEERFHLSVGVKFQLYNGLFLSLPFDQVEKTGILLSLFLNDCEEGFRQGIKTPDIVENFLSDHTAASTEREKIDLLLRFVQYAERQIVLFDALEDAAFPELHDAGGVGTLRDLESLARRDGKEPEIADRLRDFHVRLVLTAHPTQFYPGSVLGIINDLTEAISENDIPNINGYLQQLGRTPFTNKEKPTPYDEAVSLIWYLENVFYAAAGSVAAELNRFTGATSSPMRMGFWPGGDRDGNPFVEVDTTLRVADALKSAVLRCYHRDIRAVRRRLTFAGVAPIIAAVEEKLHQSIYGEHRDDRISKNEILKSLTEARDILVEKHSGLFAPLVEDLICKVNLFGLFFASLDIRQESGVHGGILESVASRGEILPADYAALSDEQKIEALLGLGPGVEAGPSEDALLTDTLRTMAAIKTIQQENGPEGCERYIISQCGRALNVVEVYGLFLLAGWRAEELSVDIVPLFETVTDLRNAAKVMRQLYSLPQYRAHLARRGDHQTIMLGFSDGTKDGGYLMANWGIYRAKEELTKVSEEFGVGVVFFDGRGGPPARGGGKTHKFYSSMGRNIASEAIELTVQGQTVSSNFGTVDSARFNIEQLLHAGVQGYIAREANEGTFSPEEESLMEQLADESYRSYEELKNHPAFLDYLLLASPLRYYSETNIGSRPAKRGGSVKLELKDLRAIPFVGAWSQMKQNVPGYYGVGAALRRLHDREGLDGVKEMHRTNLFFRTLMDNCEMAMEKSFFPLTQFLCGDARFGELWRKIFDEFELTREFLLLISGKDSLMSDYPVEKRSIQMRERIMLPLTTIQQYALAKTRAQGEPGPPTGISYEKLITRCSFGIINGARNSA